ncbi:uncharacterized protein LOC110720972 [Chenopodium quinoa]|uniref:uncharacterized protein LOC110720972 n=1 Tax=Chenopodium quinoa TaxID=63459 RepID=UPI000B77513F|nr:uncharacterized protein LOC110720972 [Chenopodium quinoa]
MGREFTEDETTTTTASLSEALLFTTMCIIGLPVEVYTKDGSVFSGIFHTASVDKGYGIILKKARMIRKGTQSSNVSNGGLIDTLVVQPGDLVQVVAKGVMLPADYASSCANCGDEETVSVTIESSRISENGAALTNERRNSERQVGVIMPHEEEDGYLHQSKALKEVAKVNGSSKSLNKAHNKLNVHKEIHERTVVNQLANGSLSATDASLDVNHANQLVAKDLTCTESVASEVSDSSKTDSDASRTPLAVPVERALQNPLPSKTAKESKLNPSAKDFSPSLPNFRSTPPLVPTVPSVPYVPNNIPAVQIAGAQPELGNRSIVPRSSWPVKFVPYATSTTMNPDNGLQYNQPIAGLIATRAQPIRHGGQYQPIQAMPSYVHPNSQNGIFGRPGQVVYIHPVSHDVIQAPGSLSSQAPHPLLASHPIHVGFAKNEGVLAGQPLPISMTSPLMANGPQSFTTPSHIHRLSSPHFSSMQPIPILGPNIPYNAKFP